LPQRALDTAKGDTVIHNAAMEPEVVDLANFLIAMGAKIAGQGGDTLRITGVAELHGVEYEIIPDRIVTGTLLLCGASTRGDVTVTGTSDDGRVHIALHKQVFARSDSDAESRAQQLVPFQAGVPGHVLAK